MEARVDIRKLQLLNDRISQTIDALNQVRLSVHGLAHSPVANAQVNPFAAPYLGYGAQALGYGAHPYGISNYAIPHAFPAAAAGLQALPFLGSSLGLQHTAFNPYAASAAAPFLSSAAAPFLSSAAAPFLNSAAASFLSPSLLSSFGSTIPGIAGGLLHSNPDLLEQSLVQLRATDPLRITQTFPFASAIPSAYPVAW